MKGLLVYFFFLLLPTNKEQVQQQYYLICDGPRAYSYHKDYNNPNQYCAGLRNCKHEILRLSSVEALRIRTDPCDWCYGR